MAGLLVPRHRRSQWSVQFHEVWVLLPPLAQPFAPRGPIWRFLRHTQPQLKLRFVVGILFLLTEDLDMRVSFLAKEPVSSGSRSWSTFCQPGNPGHMERCSLSCGASSLAIPLCVFRSASLLSQVLIWLLLLDSLVSESQGSSRIRGIPERSSVPYISSRILNSFSWNASFMALKCFSLAGMTITQGLTSWRWAL